MNQKKTLKEWWSERSKNQKYLIIGGIVFVVVFASQNKNNSYSEENNSSSSSNSSSSESTEMSESEKKVRCYRMFSGGDMSAWETAQAECMLKNSPSACECMEVLSK